MVQMLLIAGSGIFVLLGALHGVYTLQDIGNPRHFAPRDAGLLGAMQHSGVVAAAYLVTSLNFFFATPSICCGLALACFVLAAALSHT